MSSSRLCQTGQATQPKGWQENKALLRPGSPWLPAPAHGAPLSPEPPHLGLRPPFCRGKERTRPEPLEAPGAPRTRPLHPPGLPAHSSRPGSSLAPSRRRSPRPPLPQPPRRGPSEAGGPGRSPRRGTAIPAPTRAAPELRRERGAERSRQPAPPHSLPASGASSRRFRPPAPRSRRAILWGCGEAPAGSGSARAAVGLGLSCCSDPGLPGPPLPLPVLMDASPLYFAPFELVLPVQETLVLFPFFSSPGMPTCLLKILEDHIETNSFCYLLALKKLH